MEWTTASPPIPHNWVGEPVCSLVPMIMAIEPGEIEGDQSAGGDDGGSLVPEPSA
jgi:hypothetical protein